MKIRQSVNRGVVNQTEKENGIRDEKNQEGRGRMIVVHCMDSSEHREKNREKKNLKLIKQRKKMNKERYLNKVKRK